MGWKFESSLSRIELQARTIFRCDRCTDYSPKVVCHKCFPSPIFPPSYTCEKQPPKDYDERRGWDEWYMWRYMTQLVFDDEQLYEIGSEWFQHQIESSVVTAKLKLQPKRIPRIYIR